MGHSFSRWFKQSMLGEEETEGTQGGQGQSAPTDKVFPNYDLVQKAPPLSQPEYSKTMISSTLSPFDTSTTRYGFEGSLSAPHF